MKNTDLKAYTDDFFEKLLTIKQGICDEYCKYTNSKEYRGMPRETLEEICENDCPLGKLQEEKKNYEQKAAPKWIRPDRCGTCEIWNRLPDNEQPPADYGILGRCMRQGGYVTSQVEHCKHYKEKKESKNDESG